MNSEVRFHLKRGSPVARDAVLLVNKPRVTMPHYGEESKISTMYSVDEPSEIDTMSGVHFGGIPQVEYTVT